MIGAELEARLVARVVSHGGGFLQPDHVRCVFAVLRDHFTRSARGAIEEPIVANRFLVGALADGIAILALELSLRRADALNLITWIGLVGGFSSAELEAARDAAIAESER